MLACGGTGYPVVKQLVQPGRRIYPVKCMPCDGKVRSRTPTEVVPKPFVGFQRCGQRLKNRSNSLSRVSLLVLIAVFFPTFAFSLDKPVSGISPSIKRTRKSGRPRLLGKHFAARKRAKKRL